MARYFSLYLHFIRFGFSQAMQFRVDFFFRIVMDCIFYGVNIALWHVIYRNASIPGWTLDHVLVFTAGYLFVDALNMTVFSDNFYWLPILINKGDLDYYLVRPVSSLYFLMLRSFAANSFINLVIASGILWWAIARYPEPLGALRIALFVGLLVLGTFLYATMYMLSIIPTFWLHSHTGLRDIFHQFMRYMERPDQIYRGWVRRLLVSLLPACLVSSFPAHALFEGITPGRTLHIAAVVAGAFGFMVWLWHRALRAYASASS